MTVGENSFTYTDKSSGERKVRITHEWVERSTSKPPEAPEAVHPPDGGQAEGTDFAFRWSVPTPTAIGSPTTTSCSPTGRICGGRCRRTSTN